MSRISPSSDEVQRFQARSHRKNTLDISNIQSNATTLYDTLSPIIAHLREQHGQSPSTFRVFLDLSLVPQHKSLRCIAQILLSSERVSDPQE